MNKLKLFAVAASMALFAFAFPGCGQQTTSRPSDGEKQVAVTPGAGHDHSGSELTAADVQQHGGWWCYEHGVPEEKCAMCDTRLAAKLREEGDWCDEHNRPDSLCFKCHPENAEKYIALYEAKYGKKPPAATD